MSEELFVEGVSEDTVEIQKKGGALIASIPCEHLGLARVMAAAPLLFAACECTQSYNDFMFAGGPSAADTLKRHGWDGNGLLAKFIDDLRKRALEKARS